jgi:uncharacterized protein YkwD
MLASVKRSAYPNAFGLALLALLAALFVLAVQLRENGGSTLSLSSDGLRLERTEALYPPGDPWAEYLAPESECPGGDDRSAPPELQARTVVCLVNWARMRRGLAPLAESPVLSLAAGLKARDIHLCGDFAHDACGKEPDEDARAAGFSGARWGENIFAGPLELGRPRVAVDRWLNSEHHRDNVFRDGWTEQGVAVRLVPSFEGQPDVAIWVSEFGESPR